jgi:membrane associated rhomboid family serine protease
MSSLFQLVLYFVYLNDKSENPLVLHPHRMEEAWRYFTYCLIHTDWVHLTVNIIVQVKLSLLTSLV